MDWYGLFDSDEEMDSNYDEEYYNGECTCDCDHHYESEKSYPYCPMEPVIRTSVPKLKDICSATVAVSLWKHINVLPEIIKGNHDCAKEARMTWKCFKNQVQESSSQLPIPTSVKEQIGEYIGKVQAEITNWATYHFRSVFLNRAKDYIVYNFIDDLVWNCDGTINCVETAKIISRSNLPRISDIEKYHFLCTYCLKDEMQQTSPVSMKIFQEYVDFEQHPLIAYWNCYFSNELSLIPRTGNASLDCTMFRLRFVDNWPAKEYFFDHLSPEEQVQNAIWLIDECGLKYQKVILKKLNESQRITVYIERFEQIIMNYVRTGVNLTDALEMWYEVRNLITGDQFVKLFLALLNATADGRILYDVWTSADPAFKHHLLTFNHHEYVNKIFYSFQWTKDMDFLTTLLKDLKAANLTLATKQIFIGICEALFSTRENFQWLDRLFEVFFGEESKQCKVDFVLNSKSIKKLCLKYYSSRQLESLRDVLTDLFSQMPDRIPDYKRNLLHSPEGFSMCADLLGFDTNYLIEIIDDVMPTSDLATEFRKTLVFSTPVINKLKSWLENKQKKFTDLDRVIDIFLISQQDKANLKISLLGDPVQFVRECFLKPNDAYLYAVLNWVFEKPNLVQEFKEAIPVDDIFNEMLEGTSGIRFFRVPNIYSNSFQALDRFLIWRLGSASEAKKYKLKRIHSYTEINLVQTLLRRKSLDNAKQLQTLMRWFFENDSSEIANFNRIYQSKGKIAKVL